MTPFLNTSRCPSCVPKNIRTRHVETPFAWRVRRTSRTDIWSVRCPLLYLDTETSEWHGVTEHTPSTKTLHSTPTNKILNRSIRATSLKLINSYPMLNALSKATSTNIRNQTVPQKLLSWRNGGFVRGEPVLLPEGHHSTLGQVPFESLHVVMVDEEILELMKRGKQSRALTLSNQTHQRNHRTSLTLVTTYLKVCQLSLSTSRDPAMTPTK